MRKLLVLTVAICAAAGAGCASKNPCDPCGDSSWKLGNLFGHREQANYGACCEAGPAIGMPIMQQPTVVQQPCCGN